MSLSGAALEALHTIGYNWKSAGGPVLWEYKGETLKSRRARLNK